MDLLNDILASQAAGGQSNFNGIDTYVKGAQAPVALAKAREDNNILSSREVSNAQIANGDLVGALRTAKSSGDQQYQNNLMNHINQNRQTLGSIAQNLTNIAPEHRQAALNAANGTLGGLDVDTSSLNPKRISGPQSQWQGSGPRGYGWSRGQDCDRVRFHSHSSLSRRKNGTIRRRSAGPPPASVLADVYCNRSRPFLRTGCAFPACCTQRAGLRAQSISS